MTKPKATKDVLHAKGIDIGIFTSDFKNEYISLTDIARYRSDEPNDTIRAWMRNRDTIEFLGLWESLHNPNFKPVEFDGFRKMAGSNAFTMSPAKWIAGTGAVGMVSKAGNGGGTYAHSDIAFEFASWISAEFKLYIIKDYERLKAEESGRLSLDWNLRREIAKLNYRIHTDAVKNNLLPPKLTQEQKNYAYASEADLLNVALFGMTAKEWRAQHPQAKGNIRDAAGIEQLLVLANLESYNALLIAEKTEKPERLELLRKAALTQLESLGKAESVLHMLDESKPQDKPVI